MWLLRRETWLARMVLVVPSRAANPAAMPLLAVWSVLILDRQLAYYRRASSTLLHQSTSGWYKSLDSTTQTGVKNSPQARRITHSQGRYQPSSLFHESQSCQRHRSLVVGAMTEYAQQKDSDLQVSRLAIQL